MLGPAGIAVKWHQESRGKCETPERSAILGSRSRQAGRSGQSQSWRRNPDQQRSRAATESGSPAAPWCRCWNRCWSAWRTRPPRPAPPAPRTTGNTVHHHKKCFKPMREEVILKTAALDLWKWSLPWSNWLTTHMTIWPSLRVTASARSQPGLQFWGTGNLSRFYKQNGDLSSSVELVTGNCKIEKKYRKYVL